MRNLQELKSIYDNLGWVKVESLFLIDEVEEIISQIEKFYNTNKDKFLKHEVNYSNGAINSIHCLHLYNDPFFLSLSKNKRVVDIVSTLLNDSPDWRGAEAFLKPAMEGLKSPMHQDDFYWCVEGHNALTLWLALDEVSSENGGVEYINETHKLGLIEHVPSYAPGSSQTVAPHLLENIKGDHVIPVLKRGDALIHHALTLHGSSDNKSKKSRRGFTLQFKGLSSKYSDERKEKYLKSLSEQVQLRNPS